MQLALDLKPPLGAIPGELCIALARQESAMPSTTQNVNNRNEKGAGVIPSSVQRSLPLFVRRSSRDGNHFPLLLSNGSPGGDPAAHFGSLAGPRNSFQLKGHLPNNKTVPQRHDSSIVHYSIEVVTFPHLVARFAGSRLARALHGEVWSLTRAPTARPGSASSRWMGAVPIESAWQRGTARAPLLIRSLPSAPLAISPCDSALWRPAATLRGERCHRPFETSSTAHQSGGSAISG